MPPDRFLAYAVQMIAADSAVRRAELRGLPAASNQRYIWQTPILHKSASQRFRARSKRSLRGPPSRGAGGGWQQAYGIGRHLVGGGIVITTSHGVERDEDMAIELAMARLLPAVLVGRIRIRISRSSECSTRSDANRRQDSDNGEDWKHSLLALARPGRSGLQASLGIVARGRRPRVRAAMSTAAHRRRHVSRIFGRPLVDVQETFSGMTI